MYKIIISIAFLCLILSSCNLFEEKDGQNIKDKDNINQESIGDTQGFIDRGDTGAIMDDTETIIVGDSFDEDSSNSGENSLNF